MSKQTDIIDRAVNMSQHISLNWTQIVNCDNQDGWFPFWVSSFTVDVDEYVEGNGSLKVISCAPSSWPPSELTYGALDPSAWDWSKNDLIGFWFWANSSAKKYTFLLWNIHGNGVAYDFTYTKANTWQQITLPLSASVDLTKIDKFHIQVFEPSPPINITWKIDDVKVGKIELPSELSLKERNVQLNYKRINPARYEIDVNAGRPFTLVFSETYDPMWKAEIAGVKNKELEHFIVNGYANGWYVNRTGKYTIVLEYEAQKYFELGTIVSTVSAIALMAFLAASRFNQSK
jgi:hypothetical protein